MLHEICECFFGKSFVVAEEFIVVFLGGRNCGFEGNYEWCLKKRKVLCVEGKNQIWLVVKGLQCLFRKFL